MIKPQDVRIGNYVQNALNAIVKVEAIGYNILNPGIEHGSPDFKYLKGIPLSPEILVNCPDAKKMDSINWHVRLGATYLQLQFHSGKCYCTFPDGLYLGEIATLHRLQNIIYSLTNTDLTINF